MHQSSHERVLDSGGAASRLSADGYVVIERMLRDEDVSTLRGLLAARPASAARPAEYTSRGKKDMYALWDSQQARAVLIGAARAMKPLLSQFHADPFIEHTKALLKDAGAPETPWHQDAAYWSSYDPAGTMITLWVALSDCSPENGCLRFLRGSQDGPVYRHVPHSQQAGLLLDESEAAAIVARGEVVDLDLRAGDAVVFRSRLVHGAHGNRSPAARLAFKLVFQDMAQRPAQHPTHKTAMTIEGQPLAAGDGSGPGGREDRGGVADAVRTVARALKPMRKLLPAPARRMIRPITRRIAGKAEPGTLSQTFRSLRQFQLSATEREWKQLCFYYEMIDLIDEVPGDVAEFGVSGGISLVSFIRLLAIKERGYDRKERRSVYGFDSFEGLPELSGADKTATPAAKNMLKGGFFDQRGQEELQRMVQGLEHVHLIKGWFDQTLPPFLEARPDLGFALVHVDCDLYESTRTVLHEVWDRVVPGGIVVFDELYHKDFPGETKAFQEFMAGKSFVLRRSRVKPDKKYIVKSIPAAAPAP